MQVTRTAPAMEGSPASSWGSIPGTERGRAFRKRRGTRSPRLPRGARSAPAPPADGVAAASSDSCFRVAMPPPARCDLTRLSGDAGGGGMAGAAHLEAGGQALGQVANVGDDPHHAIPAMERVEGGDDRIQCLCVQTSEALVEEEALKGLPRRALGG